VRAGPAIVAAGALAALAAGTALLEARRGPAASALAAADNPGPRGLAAARALLATAGAVVVRGPGDAAPPAAAVIVVAAPQTPLGEAAVAELLAAARAGATVVFALGGARQQALLDALGLSITPGAEERRARGRAPHRLVGDLELPARSAGLRIVGPGAAASGALVSRPGQLDRASGREAAPTGSPAAAGGRPPAAPPTEGGGTPPGDLASAAPERKAPVAALVVSGDAGWASAVAVLAGSGEVLVLSGPEPLENAHLLEGDAVSLVTRLGALGPVVFDERFLAPPPAAGLRTAGSGMGLLVLQLLAAGLAAVAARARRLGAVRPPPAPAAGRTARAYLASLGALYRRAGAEDELAASAWRALRRRLERRHAVPAALPDAEAARRLARRSGAAAVALARGSAALAGGGPGVLLDVTRAAADAEAALRGRA
jgi:hypothetical protein